MTSPTLIDRTFGSTLILGRQGKNNVIIMTKTIIVTVVFAF